jgi:oligoribonuclease
VSERDDKLVWIDCEMTGLELSRDALIEIAVLVTDADLNAVDPGLDIVIGCADDVLDTMVPFVKQMHETSGLTDLVRASRVTLGEAENRVLSYIKQFVPEPKTAPLCGNSIATDRGFIARDMPELDAFLHYRMIDVSSIKELSRRWYPRVYFGQPQKSLAHRALADIVESVQELRYYRRTIFVPQPGPSTDDVVRAAAEALTEETATPSAAPAIGADVADQTPAPPADANPLESTPREQVD